jgi:hypothetical protein
MAAGFDGFDPRVGLDRPASLVPWLCSTLTYVAPISLLKSDPSKGDVSSGMVVLPMRRFY